MRLIGNVFNEDWWYQLGREHGVKEQALHDMFDPVQTATKTIAQIVTAGTPVQVIIEGVDLAQMSMTTIEISINFLLSFKCDTVGSIILGGKPMYPNINKLIDSCNKTIENAEAHDYNALRLSLQSEKDLIETVYGNMHAYDSEIYIAIVNNPCYVIAPLMFKDPYRVVKDQIAIFRHHLEIHYSYVTFLLDGKSEKLHEVSPSLMDRKLPLTPGLFESQKLDVLGALDTGESDDYSLFLEAGDLIKVDLKKGYSIAGASCINSKFTCYVKRGSQPTEDLHTILMAI